MAREEFEIPLQKMGCVNSKQTVSVTPAIDHSGVFKENENECSGSGRVVIEDPPRPILKKLASWRSRSWKRSQKSELGSELSERGATRSPFARSGALSEPSQAKYIVRCRI